MAGRGRGKPAINIDPKNSPLRRPSTSNLLNNSIDVSKKTDCNNKDLNNTPLVDSTSQKITNLSIDTHISPKHKGSKDNAEDISKTIMETVDNIDSLTKAAVDLFNYSLNGKDEALTAALVVKKLEDFSISDVSFRSIFLNEMGNTFSDIDLLRRRTPERFQCFVVLLCEFSLNFPKINVTKDAMYKALCFLLSSPTSEDIFIFREAMRKIGPTIGTEQSGNIADIMLDVRKAILSSQTSNRSRCLLLECLELYLNNWKSLPLPIKEFYTGYN